MPKESCRVCGVPLVRGQNIRECRFKRGNYTCNDCENQRVRNYYLVNRKKVLENHTKYRESHRKVIRAKQNEKWGTDSKLRERHRDYYRMQQLLVNGKRVRVQKRPYPKDNRCELCGTVRLYYHHFSDANPSIGIWVNSRCNLFADVLDDLGPEIVSAYLQLKASLFPQ